MAVKSHRGVPSGVQRLLNSVRIRIVEHAFFRVGYGNHTVSSSSLSWFLPLQSWLGFSSSRVDKVYMLLFKNIRSSISSPRSDWPLYSVVPNHKWISFSFSKFFLIHGFQAFQFHIFYSLPCSFLMSQSFLFSYDRILSDSIATEGGMLGSNGAPQRSTIFPIYHSMDSCLVPPLFSSLYVTCTFAHRGMQ